MKKGLSYVDLSISVGIFLVFFIVALVIFKPSFKEENTGNILLPIIQQNLKNDIYYTIYKYPLFINITNSNLSSGSTEYLMLEFPFNFTTQNVNVLNSDLSLAGFNFIPTTRNYNLTLSKVISVTRDVNWIIFSPEINNVPSLGQQSNYLLSPKDFAFNYGVREETKGISISKFSKLSNYSELKSRWNYPQKYEFLVFIYDAFNQSRTILEYNKISMPEEESVFSLQYQDFILYENTTKYPVLIKILTW